MKGKNKKKRLAGVWMSLVFLVSACIGTVAAEAATKTVIGFWYGENYDTGIATYGPSYLNAHGYQSRGTITTTVRERIYSALENDDVVFLNMPGGINSINYCSGGYINGANLEDANLKSTATLIYISASQAGATIPGETPIGSILCSAGASTVVSFTGEITTQANGTGGINLFNEYVVNAMVNGTVVYNAIQDGKSYIYNLTGQYWGAYYCQFTGNGGITL